MIRLIRRSSSTVPVDVEHLLTREQRQLLDRARALAYEAEATLAAAEREADRVLRDAYAEARDATSAAQAEATRVVKEADAEAARLRREVEAEAADRVATAAAEAARVRAEALEAATCLREDGQRRLDETLAEAGRLLGQAERLRALLQTSSPQPESATAMDRTSSRVPQVNPERGQVLAALKSLESAISAATSTPSRLPGRSETQRARAPVAP